MKEQDNFEAFTNRKNRKNKENGRKRNKRDVRSERHKTRQKLEVYKTGEYNDTDSKSNEIKQ